MATPNATQHSAKRPEFDIVRRLVRDKVIHVLETLPGEKDLIIDPDLLRPLDRIVRASVIKSHGVKTIYKLEPVRAFRGCDQRIYIIRSTLASIKVVCSQIQADRSLGRHQIQYLIAYAPQRSRLCDMVMEREGLFGVAMFDEIPLFVLPIDDDMLSLELDNFYFSYHVEQSWEYVGTVARALCYLKSLFGTVSTSSYAFGSSAEAVLELTQRYERDMIDAPLVTPATGTTGISHLIVFDRAVDMVAALMSPITYGGLLEETFGMKGGVVDFGPDVTKRPEGSAGATVKHDVSAQDGVYHDIRDRHFAVAAPYLSQRAKVLQSQMDKRHDMTNVSEMKRFVAEQLQTLSTQHRSLALHVGACECVTRRKTELGFEKFLSIEHGIVEGAEQLKQCIGYINECLLRQYAEPSAVLRLMCLISLTLDGVPSATYQEWQRYYLHSFGHHHLLTFDRLRRAGLLVEQTSTAAGHLSRIGVRTSRFAVLARQLQLLPRESGDSGGSDLRSPTDVSYVYNGIYRPVICRVVEQLLQAVSGSNGRGDEATAMEPTMKHLGGKMFAAAAGSFESTTRSTKSQQVPNNSLVVAGSQGDGRIVSKKKVPSANEGALMVVVLGGCTFSEAAGLRLLSKKHGREVYMLATSFVGGDTLLRTVMAHTDLLKTE